MIDELDNPILAYMGSKNAVGRAVRRRVGEWGRAGVRINAVAPGPVNTPLLQSSIDDPATRGAVEALDIPLGRRGEPEEIANLVWFMTSEEASFMHGSVIYMDGGNDAAIRPERF